MRAYPRRAFIRSVAVAVAVLLATTPFATEAQTGSEAGLEVVAELPPGIPPGNVAVTPTGRVVLSMHQFHGATPYRVVELLGDGTVVPFPTEEWASPPGPDGVGLRQVLGVNSDANGVVWILDQGGDGHAGKLVGWDSVAGRLHQVIALAPPTVPDNGFLNDLAVDPVRGFVAISDTAGGDNGALVVVDLSTGQAVRRLQGHASIVPEDVDMVIDGRVVERGGSPARIGVNPITIDPTFEYVYYGAMSGTALYRVPTTLLFDLSLSEEALGEAVERVGDKPISDGITIDAAGNVYITDITSGAIGVVDAGGAYRVVYDDELLSWPDGFAVGPDAWVYVTVNQLHRSPPLNGGESGVEPPFYVMRFPALGPAVVGR